MPGHINNSHFINLGPRLSHPPGAVPMHHGGREMPFNKPFISPEYRIYEFNKKLSQYCDDCQWWEQLIFQFFEDDANLTVILFLEDGPKRYCGVTDMHWLLKNTKESLCGASIALDCDDCVLMTQYSKPILTKVCTEGQLLLEFGFDDLLRIRNWQFTVKQNREFIPRNALTVQDAVILEELTKCISRCGLTNYTLNYLRVSVILEPMMDLMSRHKITGMPPRECLKSALYQRFQRMAGSSVHVGGMNTSSPMFSPNAVSIPTGQRTFCDMTDVRPPTTTKRRKRKTTAASTAAKECKKRSPATPASIADESMVVGEPSLMGGDVGEDDERAITRLENQFSLQTTANTECSNSLSCLDNIHQSSPVHDSQWSSPDCSGIVKIEPTVHSNDNSSTRTTT